MDVTVSSRHTQLPENLRKAAEEKIGRLDRFLDGLDRAEVHFFEQKNPRIAENQVCEVTLEGRGHHVRCKVTAPDGYVAVDRAVEKLEHQLHKLKTKLQSRPRRRTAKLSPPENALVFPDTVEEAEIDEGEAEGKHSRVVKVKRFAMMPMTPEDAADRMDLLGHGFFLFTNVDTHRSAVVYRRDDGDVGLIDEDG